MGQIVPLPTQLTVEAAWDRYVTLLNELRASEALQRDMTFNAAVVRAWADFRDALLAKEGRL